MIGCAGCKAKDSEIEFLRDEVKAMRAQIAGMADPLLQARLAQAQRMARPIPEAVAANAPAGRRALTPASTPRHSPGWLRRTREDRANADAPPTADAEKQLAEDSKVLEASFSKQP